MDKTVVILAGGASSRMGRDKAKLPYGDETLLKHMINLYGKYFDRIILSVDRPNRFNFPDVQQVIDEYVNVGPLAGIHAVFNQTDVQEFFLTAVDIPFGEPELAKKIMELGKGYSACVLKRNSGYYEPLFAMYNRNCLHEVKYCLENKKNSVMSLYQRIPIYTLNETELSVFSIRPLEEVFTNTNRPTEYFKALSKTKWDTKIVTKKRVNLNEAVELLFTKNTEKKFNLTNLKITVISTKLSEQTHNDIFTKQLLKMGTGIVTQVQVSQNIEKIMEALADAVVNEASVIIAIDETVLGKDKLICEALKLFGAPILFNSITIEKDKQIVGSRLGGVPVIILNDSYEKGV